MKNFIIIVSIYAFFLPNATNAAIITKNVKYKDGDVELVGTIAYNDKIEKPAPGILIFPEWWGKNNYVKKRAYEMAALGYVAFIADMYSDAKVTDKKEIAKKWSKPFYKDRNLMRSRALAALNAFKQQKRIDKDKIAAIGFCMGGTVAIELARSGEKLSGAVAFHAGLNFPDKIKKNSVKTKILVLNGGADPLVPNKDRETFIEDMNNANADVQFMQYSMAMHAFTNPDADKHNIPGVAYNELAEKRSMKALKNFLIDIF